MWRYLRSARHVKLPYHLNLLTPWNENCPAPIRTGEFATRILTADATERTRRYRLECVLRPGLPRVPRLRQRGFYGLSGWRNSTAVGGGALPVTRPSGRPECGG